jgi:hypothetical protein
MHGCKSLQILAKQLPFLSILIGSLLLRGRAEISSHSGASAGWADARRRDAGDAGHRRGAATPQMPVRRRAPQGGRFSGMQHTMPADT